MVKSGKFPSNRSSYRFRCPIAWLTAVLIHAECFVVFALPPIVGTKDILMAPLTAYQEEFGALPYDNAGAERAL
ncbi:MAG TPA: hypothetical protein PLJ47_15505, partial [Candidatus Hydrogenedentes bacterium]|nr:hypothetical protein [Candidatus Hydrogenedentota bacterium]